MKDYHRITDDELQMNHNGIINKQQRKYRGIKKKLSRIIQELLLLEDLDSAGEGFSAQPYTHPKIDI